MDSAIARARWCGVVLGLKECEEGLRVEGVPDAEGKIGNIWDLLDNREFVSANLLSNSDLRVMDCDGRKLIVMDVPCADRMDRPVYIHNNPRNAFRRYGEGDCRCSMEGIAVMRSWMPGPRHPVPWRNRRRPSRTLQEDRQR